MAMTEDSPDRLIVCNGFKDSSYIEAVILATKLGRTIIPVVEKFSELALILRHAETHRVRPRIGVRVKLASEGAGRWRESAGERSKFGLFTTEILELVKVLREQGHARLPAAGALPSGQPAAGHPAGEGSDQRTGARLRGTVGHRRGPEVHRRGRRSRGRLRRQRHQLLLLDELHAGRIRQRRGVPHRQRVQRAGRGPPDDHQRIGPGHRRPSQRAGIQCAGPIGAGRDRAAPGGPGADPRMRRNRFRIWPTPCAASVRAAWSSAITTH